MSLDANLSKGETITRRTGSAATTGTRSTTGLGAGLRKRINQAAGGRGMDVSLDLSYTRTDTENRTTAGTLPQRNQRDQIRLTGSTSLQFTRAMSGNFALELGQERRILEDWTRRSIRLSFSTGFNF
jgi:hypothetical protein